MTHSILFARTLVALAGLWPYLKWRSELRRERERRRFEDRLREVI